MRTALVTGVSAGIGRAAALAIAKRGFHVIGAGRHEGRSSPVIDHINSEGLSAEFLSLDLASLRSVSDAGEKMRRAARPIDVLVNNAGIGGLRGLSEDGFEIHFATNHMGHFLFTAMLDELLMPGSRVVAVSSEAHKWAKGIDYERVRLSTKLRNIWADYGVSKLANILFIRQLADRRPDLQTFAVHPGLAETNIFPAWARPLFRDRRSPEEAADTVVWCATGDDIPDVSGGYYTRRSLRDPSAVAQDDTLAEELWDRSAQWCRLDGGAE